MKRYARDQAPAVADLTRVLGTIPGFETHVGSLLELRLAQVSTAEPDGELLDYVRSAIRDPFAVPGSCTHLGQKHRQSGIEARGGTPSFRLTGHCRPSGAMSGNGQIPTTGTLTGDSLAHPVPSAISCGSPPERSARRANAGISPRPRTCSWTTCNRSATSANIATTIPK